MLLGVFASIPQTQASTINETRYFRSEYDAFGYNRFAIDQGETPEDLTWGQDGDYTLYWGTRVQICHANGSDTWLTSSPIAVVSRSTNGEGMQSETWTSNETSLEADDHFMFMPYIKFGVGGSWLAIGYFHCWSLDSSKLDSTVWIVYYWTKRVSGGGTTYFWFDFGDTTHNSRIENIEYTTTAEDQPAAGPGTPKSDWISINLPNLPAYLQRGYDGLQMIWNLPHMRVILALGLIALVGGVIVKYERRVKKRVQL